MSKLQNIILQIHNQECSLKLKFLSNVTIFSDYNYTQQVIYSSYLSGLRFKQVSINFNIREHGKSFC